MKNTEQMQNMQNKQKMQACGVHWFKLERPQSTHIQLAPHGLNDTTGCSISLNSHENDGRLWIVKPNTSHLVILFLQFSPWVHCTISWSTLVFPSYHLGEESHLNWLHSWSSYPMQWILILTSQLVSSVCRIEWFRIERFLVLWQKQRRN